MPTRGPTPEERSAEGVPVEEIQAAIDGLGSEDAAIRDASSARLREIGWPAFFGCKQRLAVERDLEAAARLREVIAHLAREHAGELWADQWFALRKDGQFVGAEHDTAVRRRHDDRSSDFPGVESDFRNHLWYFESSVTLAERGAPIRVDIRVECRNDAFLTPFSRRSAGEWQFFKEPEENAALELNASRLVEIAAIEERESLDLRLARSDDLELQRTRAYRVDLVRRDILTWDGIAMPVLIYVEHGAAEATRDVYIVNPDRGLMAGRLRGYEIVRLRGDPSESAGATAK